jgi:inorganic triphosphatase YgiF
MGVRVSEGKEIELKLRVPAERLAAVQKAVEGRNGAPRTHLQASYIDTPDHDLADAGMGWRVRREGRRWVQTLKAQLPDGGDGLCRVEHNVVVSSRTRPDADPALHLGTPAGDLLAATLAKASAPPREQFHTDVWRRARQLRAPGGTVELALDTGVIASGERSMKVCELEIELVRGRHHAVIQTGRQWVERHGLWVDATTKAQRGVMLSAGLEELPLLKTPLPRLTPDMSVDAAIREMTRACLVSIMGNASAAAAGFGGHEHVHQTRIGIRKLRSVLKVFGDYSTAPDPQWGEQLALVFAKLGASRDRDVVLHEWAETLRDAGAPAIVHPPASHDDPASVLREPSFSLLLLDLLDYVHSPALDDDADLTKVVSKELARLRRRSLRHSKQFTKLSVTQQHDVRKRVKQLRYVAELTASLFGEKKVRKYVRAIMPAQEALGVLNDVGVAGQLYRTMTFTDPQAWFAVGWLASRRDEIAQTCVAPLRDAEKAAPYWRH